MKEINTRKELTAISEKLHCTRERLDNITNKLHDCQKPLGLIFAVKNNKIKDLKE